MRDSRRRTTVGHHRAGRRRTATLALAAALLAAPRAAAQTGGAAGDPLAVFDAYAAQAVRDWKTPGLAVAVVRNDSVVFAKGYGVRTLGRPEPVEATTLFAVGSTTKAMTAAALAMLVDEGRVRLDDPVTKYLPTFELADPYVTRELTVRDLLTHRSGLPTADGLWYASPASFDTLMRRLRNVKPARSLRSGYAYQNMMYGAAGAVVAAASGVPWGEFVTQRIFRPLGMTRTVAFYAQGARLPNVATPHAEVDDTLRPIAHRNIDNIGPAGSVYSSAADMARWMRFLLDSARVRRADGPGALERRLIADSTFRELWTPQFVVPAASFYPTARLARPRLIAYGLGWFLHDYRGQLVAMHTGSIDGMSAIVGLLPEERVGIVVLANGDHAELRHALMFRAFDAHLGGATRDWSRDLRPVYDSLDRAGKAAERKRDAARVKGTRPSLALGDYAGSYSDSLYGSVTVRQERGRLVLEFGPLRVGDLEHWHYDTFRARWRDRVLGNGEATFALDPARRRATGVSLRGFGSFARVVGAAAPPKGRAKSADDHADAGGYRR